MTRRIHWLVVAAVLGTLTGSPPATAGLVGDEVGVTLTNQLAPGFSKPTAVVGPSIEFAKTWLEAGGTAPVLLSVDLDEYSVKLTYRSYWETAFNLGIISIDITDLDWVGAPGSDLYAVVLRSSTFPPGTFDAVTFAGSCIRMDLSDPNLVRWAGSDWTATFDLVPVNARALELVVNSTADDADETPGDSVCETAAGNSICTLRAAIQEGNAQGSAASWYPPRTMC
ncbi:MAG: CSLREA domain-containing protein [Deltaproteobacteria bacterium]|nr:CSLREA domain-containing protein [Deltaproteobacteria bacterium]